MYTAIEYYNEKNCLVLCIYIQNIYVYVYVHIHIYSGYMGCFSYCYFILFFVSSHLKLHNCSSRIKKNYHHYQFLPSSSRNSLILVFKDLHLFGHYFCQRSFSESNERLRARPSTNNTAAE